ncbi:MAG: leucyl/phenylalanyl-tRNA--protein transferase [Alphaproteobacteria bacterium]|nr:leucyl/phenylalanyl-tRNA--protein transferase [Alphaproteobacteria bacterium]
MTQLTPHLLLQAYAQGYFPMAESRHGDDIRWYEPELRGVIPLENFHVPRSLEKFLKKAPFHYSMNRAFSEVIRACAQRDSTWINDEIIDLYCQLHEMGYAHSAEVWIEKTQSVDSVSRQPIAHDGAPWRNQEISPGAFELIGGLYGVSLGRAFFGESMFSRTSNASKAALVFLVQQLRDHGYTLLDAQYVNDHLKQFGIIEITKEAYLARLNEALA